jgi:hypothetical protein
MPVMKTFPFGVNGNTVHLRRSDYKEVIASLYSEEEFRTSKTEFWPAFSRCSRRQGRLICWYILAIILEAWLAGKLAANHGKYKDNTVYKWLADKFLFSYISEWHPLLTPYLFVEKETRVQADMLCTNGTLYQGIVTQHFVKNGTLTGIFLSEPKRFDRERYQKDREAYQKDKEAHSGKDMKKPETKDYWTKIPSENLYFFADKIFNMNLTYLPPQGKVAEIEAIKKLIMEVLGGKYSSMNIRVTQDTGSAADADSEAPN